MILNQHLWVIASALKSLSLPIRALLKHCVNKAKDPLHFRARRGKVLTFAHGDRNRFHGSFAKEDWMQRPLVIRLEATVLASVECWP